MTFTLDQATIARLEQAAARTAMPKSEVVRAAIAEYHDKLGRLSERERLTMLRAFDDLISKIPGRSAAEADRELSPFDARVPPAVVCVVIGRVVICLA